MASHITPLGMNKQFLEEITDRNETKPYAGGIEVIGAGFGRTGTTSLKKALEILYEHPCYHFSDIIHSNHIDFWTKAFADRKVEDKDPDYTEVLAGNIAVVAHPASLKFEEILAQYPDAKVILTVRDPEKWYLSVRETIIKMVPSSGLQPFGIQILFSLSSFWKRFGRMVDLILMKRTFHGKFTRDNAMACYNQWLREVKAKVPHEKLLIFDVREGWKPLCDFLGKKVPDQPLPHLNETEKLKNAIAGLENLGLVIIVTVSSIVTILVAAMAMKMKQISA